MGKLIIYVSGSENVILLCSSSSNIVNYSCWWDYGYIVTDLHKTGEDSDEDELFQINDHL